MKIMYHGNKFHAAKNLIYTNTTSSAINSPHENFLDTLFNIKNDDEKWFSFYFKAIFLLSLVYYTTFVDLGDGLRSMFSETLYFKVIILNEFQFSQFSSAILI